MKFINTKFMKCKNCGKEFTPKTVIAKYCSISCGNEFRKKHDINMFYPSITFECAECGRKVVTDGTAKDKRTRFCCQPCERKYWKHRGTEDKHIVDRRTNFKSARHYAAWEKYTNENF